MNTPADAQNTPADVQNTPADVQNTPAPADAQNTPGQFEPGPPARRRRIGGTDIAILLGVPSFGSSPLDVYNRIVLGLSSFQGNVFSQRGNKYEQHVREQYVKQTGATLRPHPGIIVFGNDAFAASLDDIAERRGQAFPVDYKTASINGIKKWGPPGSDRIPANYLCQVDWYCLALEEVLGIVCDHSELFAAFGTDVKDASTGEYTGEFKIEEYRPYVIARDRKREERARNAARKFWDEHVLTRTPPVDPKAADAARWASLIVSPPPTGTEMSLFARLSSSTTPPAVVAASATLPPAAAVESRAASLEAELRAQAPSEPEDDVLPVADVIPPDAATLEQALAAAAPAVESEPAKTEGTNTEGVRRGRGRPRKETAQSAPATGVAGTAQSTGATPVTAPAAPVVPNVSSAQQTTIYVDVPAMPAAPLAPYVSGLISKIEKTFGVQDIRCAPKKFQDPERGLVDHPLAFGGWRALVAATTKAEPPAAGTYRAPEFSNEIVHEVLATLELAGAQIIRGAR